MRRKMFFLVAIAFSVFFLTMKLSNTAYAALPPQQDPSGNQASVDITINDAGDISVGGINLTALGVGRIDGQATTIAKNLTAAQLVVQDQVVTVDLQGTQVAKIDWSPASRQAAVNLATSYGVQLQPEVQQRIEEWISSSNLDVTARFTNEPSKPLNLSLSKPILVDVAPNGQLAIERGPLATGIDTNVLQQIERGGNQATACWNKGKLTAAVNGSALPTITLNPQGVTMLTNALNMPLDTGVMNAVSNARFGVDLSLPGGSHSTDATCE